MVNENLRQALNEVIPFNKECPTVYFDNLSYDNSIIGVTEDFHICYDYEKMIDEARIELGLPDTEEGYQDAVDWVNYNTIGYGLSGYKMPYVIDVDWEFVDGYVQVRDNIYQGVNVTDPEQSVLFDIGVVKKFNKIPNLLDIKS